jgi:SAM-dependent methyltransferase
MVHALREIQRVLKPDGILIDLRPLGDNWQVEVASRRGVSPTGNVNDLPAQTEGDIASNQTMEKVEALGWFRREQENLFPFYYSWDAPSEMEAFIADDWGDFIELNEQTIRSTRSAWAIGEADSRVQIKMKVLITRWRKMGIV